MTTELPPAAPAPAAPPPRKNTFAKVALIVAIIAFVLGCIPFVGFLSWVIAAAAIVLAIIGLTRPALPKGSAVAGLIVGAVALIVGPSIAITSVVALAGGTGGSRVQQAVAGPTASASTHGEVPLTDDGPSEAPTQEAEESEAPTVDVPTKTYTGSGDKVLKVDYTDPLIVTFSCSGCSSNTVVKTDSGFDTLLVNEIGSYKGTHILNVGDGALLSRFVIEANAKWKLKIEDLATFGQRVKRVEVGQTIKGSGDDVIYVGDGVTDSEVENRGESNFVLHSYGGSDSLPVNEIGSYRGNVVLDGPAVVQVESDGKWKITGNG